MTTLEEKVRDILDSSDFNDLPYEERVRISKYKAHTQILTLWQVLNRDKDLTNERWRKRIRSWLENCVKSYREEFAERKEELSRADRFDFTLDEETEKRLYELLTDMDTRNTNSFCIQDKRGYHAEYVKVIRCKDCKYYEPYDCGLHTGTWFPESYCDRAERKEE